MQQLQASYAKGRAESMLETRAAFGEADNFGSGSSVGLSAVGPTQVWSIDQIATQLASGYWGGTQRGWDLSAGGRSIWVNISALSSTGQFYAREALALWGDITGIRFVESTSVGPSYAITFSQSESGAFTNMTTGWNGRITSASINIGSEWIAGSNRNLNSYAFQTYIHEIGHALGLGHGGNYNETAEFSSDALYLNDSWATTVMSYFDQQESSYFRQQGFSFNYVMTPQMGDVAAITLLYGAPTNARVSDTTYGFNSTAGRAVFDATKYPTGSYTVVDSGGTDTLDYSGFSNNQLLDLRAGFFSNVGPSIGNVSIALGTVIENAIGGNGADRLIGNEAANRLTGGAGDDVLEGRDGNDILIGGIGSDVLTGGLGADWLFGGDGADLFSDLSVNFNGDTIDDFTSQDSVLFGDADLASFLFSLSGNVLSFTGGSLIFAAPLIGTLTAFAAAGGGVRLAQSGGLVAGSDFNADGRSDSFLQSTSGSIAIWRGQSSGNLVEASGLAPNALDSNWKPAGFGDFNGDGRDDVLWRHSSGVIGEWLGQTGAFTNNSGVAANAVDTSWSVVGVADYNGDGRDDILWRHVSGEIGEWLAAANGSFANNGGAAANLVDPSWKVMASGDFNGDGRADVIWQHSSGVYAEWQGSVSGKLNNAGSVMGGATGSIVGSGDFNGDGRDDILIRNATSGSLTVWQGQGNGQFIATTPSIQVTDLTWKVVDIGDFNGDGRDDLFWKHSSGSAVEWLGTAAGDFVNNGALPSVPAGWTVQSPDIWVI